MNSDAQDTPFPPVLLRFPEERIMKPRLHQEEQEPPLARPVVGVAVLAASALFGAGFIGFLGWFAWRTFLFLDRTF